MNGAANMLGLACCWVLLLGVANTPAGASDDEPEMCILEIKGDSIANLTLISQGDDPTGTGDGLAGKRFVRPGKTLLLPAGRYRLETVELDGGYQCQSLYAWGDDWFELGPGKPNELVVGAPLSPKVTARRHGQFLQMDYDLVDAAGRSYAKATESGERLIPPRFTVYKGDEVLGSESFEYG